MGGGYNENKQRDVWEAVVMVVQYFANTHTLTDTRKKKRRALEGEIYSAALCAGTRVRVCVCGRGGGAEAPKPPLRWR